MGALRGTCGAGKTSSLQCWLLRGLKARRGLLVELASRKTLARNHACSSSRSFQTLARPRQHRSRSARIQSGSGKRCDAARRHSPHSPHYCTASAASPRVEMPAEKYDDEDEVGTGLYVLIGCAAVTVVLMYSWIGYTLYQGFKARRKVD